MARVTVKYADGREEVLGSTIDAGFKPGDSLTINGTSYTIPQGTQVVSILPSVPEPPMHPVNRAQRRLAARGKRWWP